MKVPAGRGSQTIRRRSVRHERHEASAGAIVKGIVVSAAALAALVLFATLVQVGPRGLVENLGRPILRQTTLGQAPPAEPVLEVDARTMRERIESEEEAALNGAAWLDRERGIVRIPIERAMEIVAARGLPYRSVPAQAGAPPSSPAPVPASVPAAASEPSEEPPREGRP